jgi:hypothetical protein
MKRKQFKGIRILLILAILVMGKCPNLWGATLHVIGSDNDSQIFVNDTFISNRSAMNVTLGKGSYHIKVVKGGLTQFSKMIDLAKQETKTVLLDTFIDVKPVVVNRGAENKEVARLKESKGNWGIGVQLANVTSGVSLKWLPGPFGIQIGGMLNNGMDTSFKSLNGRLIYQLSDRLSKSQLMSLYSAVGYGLSKNKYTASVYTPGSYSGGTYTWGRYSDESRFDSRTIVEGVVGLEFSAAGLSDLGLLNWSVFGILSNLMNNFDNSFLNIEMGLENVMKNGQLEHSGLKVGCGAHFYF